LRVGHYYAVQGQKPREIAARVLLQRERGTDFIENLLEREAATARLAAADRGLCQELAYGAVRWQGTLDELIARKTQGREQKAVLQVLLRLGLYQIFWLDRIPNHAAVHETVELAKQLGCGPQAGFVNALLRGYLREQPETENLLRDWRQTNPALGFSHPAWLVERWQNRWGAEKTAAVLAHNNTPPSSFARLNTLKADAARLTAQWRHERVEFAPRHWDWTGGDLVFELQSHPPLAELKSFQEGWFYIQDPSTLLAVQILDPQPGETVLDLCAAPGGKTTFIAQRMNNQGRIVAGDNVPARLKLVQENCTRLGVACVQAGELSAVIADSSSFDRILVDAPCSNTGVLRRRVDLRWRIRAEEVGRLALIQLQLLEQAAVHLKPGGTLVYSTCSLEPEENRELVLRFLARKKTFRLESDRELLPFTESVDGAYVARLKTDSRKT